MVLHGKEAKAYLEVVGKLEKVLGKFLHGIVAGVLDLTLAAMAQVLHIGQRPQILVL